MKPDTLQLPDAKPQGCTDCGEPLTGDEMLDREVHGRCSDKDAAHLSGPDSVAGVVGHIVDVIHETGKQGSSTQHRPGAPTTTILNSEGQAIAWDVVEEFARHSGLAAAASNFKLKRDTVYQRKLSHKWKGIPDGRSLAKVEQGSSVSLDATPGDFTRRITAHRERVFKIASDSLGKKKSIPIKNARDYDIVDKIARRAAGINDDDVATANVLIHINEQIDNHEAATPIEAHEVLPCDTVPLPPLPNELRIKDALISEAGEQSQVKQSVVAPETSRTLNVGDAKRRQFVLPGTVHP